uniref:Uncharacterized protein n=1 Tax=Anguilla anguilla TaxID=7936 RepID=A0A0E9XGW8_ANGAN
MKPNRNAVEMYNCQSVKCWGNFWMGNLMDTVSRFKCSFVNSICDHVFFLLFFLGKTGTIILLGKMTGV